MNRFQDFGKALIDPRSALLQLAQAVPTSRTWEEAYEESPLRWDVEKRRLLDPLTQEPIDAHGLFRKDTNAFFGTCGERYQIVQNREAFRWIDPLMQMDDQIQHAVVGDVCGGAGVFTLASLPSRITVGDDVIVCGLLFTNWHLPGTSASAALYMLRQICANGMTAAFQETGVRIPHRGDVGARLEEAVRVVSRAQGMVPDIEAVFQRLVKISMSSERIGEVLQLAFPKIENSPHEQVLAAGIYEMFEDNDAGAFPEQAGTAYALVNAAIRYADHAAAARPRAGESAEQARARAAMFGAGSAMKFDVLKAVIRVLTDSSLLSVSEKEARTLGIL